MNSGPPKRRSSRPGAPARRRADARNPSPAGVAPSSAGARRRRQRAKPDRKRLWRIVLWAAVAVGVAWIAVAVVLFVGDGEELPPPRPVEVTATTRGCELQPLTVEPGEPVVLRVTNTTGSDFEVIVTDEAGVALRLSPGYDPDDPVGSGAWAPGGHVTSHAGRLGPPLLAAGLLAHEGHEDEAGPNATADFRYRMIVAENGVRIMLVTFPEIGEFAPLTRLLCAAIGPDGSLDAAMPVGRVAVAGLDR